MNGDYLTIANKNIEKIIDKTAKWVTVPIYFTLK